MGKEKFSSSMKPYQAHLLRIEVGDDADKITYRDASNVQEMGRFHSSNLKDPTRHHGCITFECPSLFDLCCIPILDLTSRLNIQGN
ncbi:hypothetical protein HAX54_020013 [Datura stramonium]|uniref:Uncharacterized protein n=1 Tax=Datura stramonium TaxID=4076 RepID=A0ABS8S2Z7_DATST|nr:hypothetical protein [Datura stramonium]